MTCGKLIYSLLLIDLGCSHLITSKSHWECTYLSINFIVIISQKQKKLQPFLYSTTQSFTNLKRWNNYSFTMITHHGLPITLVYHFPCPYPGHSYHSGLWSFCIYYSTIKGYKVTNTKYSLYLNILIPFICYKGL